MSEAKYRIISTCDDHGDTWMIHDDAGTVAETYTSDHADRIVAALNENENETLRQDRDRLQISYVRVIRERDELLEQVRLYELAAERGWSFERIDIMWWVHTGFVSFSGPTPTAAIAAAEKKEASR